MQTVLFIGACAVVFVAAIALGAMGFASTAPADQLMGFVSICTGLAVLAIAVTAVASLADRDSV